MLNGIGLSAEGVKLTEQAPESKETVTKDAPGVTEALKDATEPKAAEPKKEEPLSSRFAALARKEKEARKKSEEAKARFSELEAREAKLKEQEESYSLGKKNPIEALKRLGWSYEDITNHILNDQKPTAESEIKSVRDEIEKLRREKEEEKETQKRDAEERQKAQYQKAIDNFKTEMRDFIGSNAESYELITLHEQEDLVYATIEEHYQKTLGEGKPKILSNKEACDLVENYLEEQLEKLTQTKKFKTKYQVAQEKKEQEPKKDAPKTLSNSMVASSAPSGLPAKTEQERLQRALAALSK